MDFVNHNIFACSLCFLAILGQTTSVNHFIFTCPLFRDVEIVGLFAEIKICDA